MSERIKIKAMSSNLFRLALGGSLTALALASATPALAQDAEGDATQQDQEQADEATPGDDQVIVITGTLLKSTEQTAISPVTTMGPEDIKLERSVFADELISSLPQLAGGIGAGSVGNDAFGASVVDLRGLGQNRTLVLIDGKRGAPFGFRNSVDVSSIPGALVERVEVLTGGASISYGADAVVGVVNYIMRHDLDGVEMRAGVEISDEGDGRVYYVNGAYGMNIGDHGNVTLYAGYTDRNGVLAGKRDFASPRRNDAGITTVRPAGGTFTQGGSVFSFTDDGQFTTTPQRSEFSAINSLILPSDRIDTGLLFHYEFSPHFEVYGRASFSSTDVGGFLDPVEATRTVTIRDDNPYLTPEIRNRLTFDANGEAQVSVQRSYAEFGPVTRDTRRNNFQGQFGIRGEIASTFTYDAYAQYGRSDENNTIYGEGITARVNQAANATVNGAGAAVCVDPSNGCAPANLFGPGSISPEAVAFISQPVHRDRLREQTVAGLTISGDSSDFLNLPAGAIEIVLGYEYRDENAREDNDNLVATGQTFEQGSRPSIKGGFDVHEFFVEGRIPLLADLPLIQQLDFEGGYRHSDFSSSGTADTYKLGGNWIISDDLRIRGSYQTAIRSPNVGELFGPQASIPLSIFVNNGRLVDPCSNPAVTGASTEQCARQGAPAAPYTTNVGNAPFLFGGNPNLLPEKADSYTIGGVLTPRFLPGFSLAVDYFNIKIDGGLFVIFPWDAAQDCYVTNPSADNPLCSLIPRGANGQFELADVTDRNVSTFSVEGLDINARYRIPLGEGLPGDRIILRYVGSLVFDQKRQNSPFTAVLECEGSFGSACAIDSNVQADYRHLASVNWGADDWSLQFSWQHIGPVRHNGAAALVERLEAQDYFDLSASLKVTDNIEFIAGVENIFDKKPPLAFTNQEAFNTFPNTYDVLGARYGLDVRVSF